MSPEYLVRNILAKRFHFDFATKKSRPPREWFEAKTQFAVMFKERFVLA